MAVPNQQAQQIARSVGQAPKMQTLNNQALLQESQRVRPQVRKYIAGQALRSQVLKKTKSFYSVVRFPFSVTQLQPPNGTTYRYELTRKKVVAFSYGAGDDMASAGFPPNYRATDCDTNLLSKFDTGGSTVVIYGISLHLSETSDAYLTKLIWADSFVDISLDGSQRFELLGRPGRISSPGGLYGSGQSRASVPGVGEAVANVGSITNGMPHANNFYRLANKITWNPASMIDSRFQLRFEVPREIAFNVDSRTQAPGVTAYTPPATGEIGTYVDIVAYLHTHEMTPRSKQQ